MTTHGQMSSKCHLIFHFLFEVGRPFIIFDCLINKAIVMAEDTTADATRRLNVKKQTLDDAYAAPANFLEIDVVNPVTTMGVGKKRYTDYEVRMRVSNSPYRAS